MLFWRMHRCRADHLLPRLPPRQDDARRRRSTSSSSASATSAPTPTAEVRRSFNGTYPPLYQAAYMIGGLQIRALHKELVESGRMTAREFHDAILQGGRMPIEMVRARLTGELLPRDYTARWRFAGDLWKPRPPAFYPRTAGVGAPALPTRELRVWAGAPLPPPPFHPGGRPALPSLPGGGTAGKLRVGAFAAGFRFGRERPHPVLSRLSPTRVGGRWVADSRAGPRGGRASPAHTPPFILGARPPPPTPAVQTCLPRVPGCSRARFLPEVQYQTSRALRSESGGPA